jgi:hypothetical protein
MGTNEIVYRRAKQVAAWSCRRSRNSWKQRASNLQKEKKVLTVRVADVLKSREEWRSKFESARIQLKVYADRQQDLELQLKDLERQAEELRRGLAQQQSEPSVRLQSVTAPDAKKKSKNFPTLK